MVITRSEHVWLEMLLLVWYLCFSSFTIQKMRFSSMNCYSNGHSGRKMMCWPKSDVKNQTYLLLLVLESYKLDPLYFSEKKCDNHCSLFSSDK